MEGFLQGGRLDSLVQGGLGQTRVDFRAGRMRKNAGAGGEREKLRTVSVKRGTDEQTDNTVKADDPRSDLLLSEGEENDMQN